MVAQTLKSVRITRAGLDLAQGTSSLEAVARRSGYPNLRSFSRAFVDIYGVPPGEYRVQGGHIGYSKPYAKDITTMYTVEIENLPQRHLIGLLHKGSYLNIGESFEKLVSLGVTRGLMPHVRGMVGVYYDDPMGGPEDELRSHAAFIVESDALADDPLTRETLTDGPYAVLTHKGPYSDLPAAYDWFYSVWLKDGGHSIRSAPPYENYLNNPRNIPASELITKVCVPIEKI